MSFDVLRLQQGAVTAQVVPARGALVSSLSVDGREVLYLDRATLEDPDKNVRGGIPVLFPYAGKLAGDLFLPAGTRMKQHGFGRNRPWAVREKRPDFVRLVLEQDAGTRAQYPYAYEAEYRVRLLPRGVQLELLVHATGRDSLPLSPGWHPYFCCPAERKDQVRGDVPGLSSGLLANDREIDFGLAAPACGRARFEIPGLGPLALEFSPELRHLQFWSQPGKDFICLEPFYGPNDTVNTERRLEIASGQARVLWMRIEAG